jgi:hypothetical protein
MQRSKPTDLVNYTLRNSWKELLFIMHILKERSKNTQRLTHTALVRPITEYEAVCWDHTVKVR